MSGKLRLVEDDTAAVRSKGMLAGCLPRCGSLFLVMLRIAAPRIPAIRILVF